MRIPRAVNPIGLALIALIAGACSGATTAGGTAAGRLAPVVSPPGGATLPVARLLVGRSGAAGLEVVATTGAGGQVEAVPLGAPRTDDWRRVVATVPDGARTKVVELGSGAGSGGPVSSIEGLWALPTIGPDPVPSGVSANGRTIVLVEAGGPAAAGRSRFAVLTDGLGSPARVVDLPGRFSFDALSADGRTLYVVEHLDTAVDGHYQVRAVDLPEGRLRDGVVVDKTNVDEAMAGYPLAQVRHADGAVFTLYRGLTHPFIHALNTTDGWALCLDLPEIGAADSAAARDWDLAETADGRSIYAANATLGLVAEVDPVQYGIRRLTSFRPLDRAGVVGAGYRSGPGSSVAGPRVVVAPDGRTIYAAADGGIRVIRADDLSADRTLGEGSSIAAIAIAPDGGTVFALRGDGRIEAIATASGRSLGTVPGDGYDRLIGIVPR